MKNGDKFGWAGEGQMPMANGHEIDIRRSTFAALQQQPTPDGAVLLTDPAGMVRIANGIIPWKEGGAAFDYFSRVVKPRTTGSARTAGASSTPGPSAPAGCCPLTRVGRQ